MRGETDKPNDVVFYPAVVPLFFIFEGLQNEEVSDSRLKRVQSQCLLEEILGRGEVSEECAPGAQFCLSGALNHDVEVFAGWEGGLEEGDDGWKEGTVTGSSGFVCFGCAAFVVDFFVEDVVEEYFEAVREVGEVGEVAAEGEGCWGAEVCEAVLEEVGEEEVGLGEES